MVSESRQNSRNRGQKMRKLGIAVTILAIPTMLGLAGCGNSSSEMPSAEVSATNSQGVPNYANSSNWLALPQTSTREVDVFYLSDTTYQKAGPSSPNIGPIDDLSLIHI